MAIAGAVMREGTAYSPDGALYVAFAAGSAIASPSMTGTLSHYSTPVYDFYNLGVPGDANYEKMSQYIASNVYILETMAGGTGSVRGYDVRIGSTNIYAFRSSALTCPGAVVAASGTAVPAGGSATVGLKMSSTSNLGVYAGSGVPTMAAAKGSLYLRTDGSSTSTRAYINTDGNTTWTNLTSAA